MRYLAVACDYDGTLASQGKVEPELLQELAAVKASGRKVLLVTGRELEDLIRVLPEYEIFDLIVAENGGLIYNPATKEARPLTESPQAKFVEALQARGVTPLSVGHCIVATWEPHEVTVVETIRELGLEMQVIFNKGAVMILPSGVNKGTGLQAALKELGISRHNMIGVGDAENDHAFMSLCEMSVAVANALESIKERADMVTKRDRGRGVMEMIEHLIANDLVDFAPLRHLITYGWKEDGHEVKFSPYGTGILIAGISSGGKSKATLGILEHLAEADYQFCLLDPEGDYGEFGKAITLGDPERPPSVEEVIQVLADPHESAVLNLLGLPLEDRPKLFASLLPRIIELRVSRGRPHFLIVDEAHHLLPTEWKAAPDLIPDSMGSFIFITVHPDRVVQKMLNMVDIFIGVGENAQDALKSFAENAGLELPDLPTEEIGDGKGIVWNVGSEEKPQIVRLVRSELERARHKRKYAEGELPEHCSFYFRGPENKLNLRVQNLTLFNQIADGIDDDTWMHHLHKHDYSKWFKERIKDEELYEEALRIESDTKLSAQESREQIRIAIEERYTAAA